MMISSAGRLVAAEREGLRLALISRTLVVALAFVGYLSWAIPDFVSLTIVGIFAFMTSVGAGYLYLIRRRQDQPWMKYAIYSIDIAAICAAFVLVPVTAEEETPQLLVYRAYGVYYLFPIVALAALSLSPRLVLWTGICIAVGWLTAYYAIT